MMSCVRVSSALLSRSIDKGRRSCTNSRMAALADAQAAGVLVRRGTRCAYGQVVPGPHDTLADTGGLSPVKARLALVLELLATEPC